MFLATMQTFCESKDVPRFNGGMAATNPEIAKVFKTHNSPFRPI